MVEVVRSFSFKLSLPNYQNADFFCSQKRECPESEAEKVSEILHDFCKNEVIKSINRYKQEFPPAKQKPNYKQARAEDAQIATETQHKVEAVEGIIQPERIQDDLEAIEKYD